MRLHNLHETCYAIVLRFFSSLPAVGDNYYDESEFCCSNNARLSTRLVVSSSSRSSYANVNLKIIDDIDAITNVFCEINLAYVV